LPSLRYMVMQEGARSTECTRGAFLARIEQVADQTIATQHSLMESPAIVQVSLSGVVADIRRGRWE
ncbi:hypothetical protein, partial [Pseudomonas protegens]|uniref:hypothetical protein n=1 Tax=Pseudomonas protegens TaxID=380021 RepID=UPI002772C53E